MIGYSIFDLVEIAEAELQGAGEPCMIEQLLIDSRKLTFPRSTLFIALKTSSRDGHQFIPQLYEQGVRNFMVTHFPSWEAYPLATFLKVKDTLEALQSIATYHREKFSYPVIGITGSNGKTIVKEWIHHLLQGVKNNVRSPRSFNSQLGVPLSVWQMNDQYDLAIFEAGISKLGEMKRLERIIQPTLGLITNIGDAHAEGFSTLGEKLNEKMRLFDHVKGLIYCSDQEVISKAVTDKFSSSPIKIYDWGSRDTCFVQLVQATIRNGKTTCLVQTHNKEYRFSIPYIDPIALENAMHAFTCSVVLGLENLILGQFESLPPLQMRLEVKKGVNGCLIVNDAYNADLTGLISALDFMGLQSASMDRVAILSDVSGVSVHTEQAYVQIASHLQLHGIQKLFAVGKHFSEFRHLFSEINESHFFETSFELIQALRKSHFTNELILIKGQRSFEFEQLMKFFELQTHQTRLEVDLAAISHNLRQYKTALPPETQLMVMVKAFSYGAGSFEIAHLLQFHGVEQMAVAYIDEGVELRKMNIHMPIMVMNIDAKSFMQAVDFNLEPELYSLDIIEKLHQFLDEQGVRFFPVHIKLDTGMHRLGLNESDVAIFIKRYASSSRFRIKTVFTHLVAAENPLHDGFTQLQLNLFERMCGQLQSGIGYVFVRHAANTAAISRHPSSIYEMVRLGIGLYGIDTGGVKKDLIEAVHFKTTVAQIKWVKAGETVGYGRNFILGKDTCVATIRVGYADGFPRTLGNGRGMVKIREQVFPILGSVCMDMTMVDITSCPSIQVDDEVILFGKGMPLTRLAEDAETIPYEIMTGISQRVPRVYLSD